MSLPVILQREAEEQIVASARWWAEHCSIEQAERWYAGILEAIESLGKTASQYPLARENEHFPCELRQRHFGLGNRSTHRILFTIRPDAILVLTVRHAAQDDWNPGEV